MHASTLWSALLQLEPQSRQVLLSLGMMLHVFDLSSFQGSQGRAYLFNAVVNVGCGPAEERVLLTGLHAVADIYCENCKTTLGWKYEHAFETSQKYKEGKFIIELAHMIKDNGWD
ncbi:protein yippee-like 2 isoform X1 [Acipenser ruthenus]|uniref:protein yippee-like 2 isoform X1 n=1 Tax=Acipenser ruthenus TaxID=7906 RepID=UPI00274286AB|nr:protein yippee-like 2 isoform X1 [Acipenser ruthenus]